MLVAGLLRFSEQNAFYSVHALDNSLSDMNNLEFEANYVNAMPRVGLLGTWKIISLVT